MDHWFDHLTKQLATSTPSRRAVMAGAGVALCAAATNGRWLDAFAAVRPGRPAPRPITAKTATFGPCTVYSKGAVYEHRLASTATAGGHTAVLHKTHSVDPKKGTTLDTTVLVDGKQQAKLTGTYTKSSRSETLVLGDAFGFGGAVLTSSDDGATLRGTVGGKTIEPYVVGSGKKLRFVNGQPARTKETPGISDAIKAVFAKADSDQTQCTSSAHAFHQRGGALALEPYRARHDAHRELTQETSCDTSAPNQAVYGTTLTCAQYNALIKQSNKLGGGQSIATTETWFTGLCQACQNKCSGNLFDEVANLFECAGSIAEYCANGCDKCKKFVNYSGVQFNCQQGCSAKGAACNPVPCPEGATSCKPDQVCVYGGNYAAQFGAPGAVGGLCCPKSHPHSCGNPGNSVQGSSACCGALAPCVYDTRFRPLSTAGNTNYAGYLCCPENRICGKLVKGIFVGQCCLPDQTCCDSTVCCPQGQRCAVQAAVHLPQQHAPNHLSTPGGAKVCCPPNQVKGGQCCQSGHWCGNECCDQASAPGCPGGKCAPASKLCLTGVHCGFVCCENGCADAKTSTCKKPKCGRGHYECQPNQYNATSVCCRTGATCANGKCCPRRTTACGHKTNGAFGCWPPSQCQQAPPIK